MNNHKRITDDRMRMSRARDVHNVKQQLPYLYAANMNQSGSDPPVVDVIVNDFAPGEISSWVYQGTGNYLLATQIPSADIKKVFCTVTPPVLGAGTQLLTAYPYIFDNSGMVGVVLYTYVTAVDTDHLDSALGDGILQDYRFDLRYYK